jgi:hypothetical protein
MKNIRKIVQVSLIALGLMGAAKTGKSQTAISGHFFGENAWMPDTIGNANACTEPPCILYGKLHKNWENIKTSGASIVRFGGITSDKNMPTNYQYIKMIDSIRAKGMEPTIQVPFRNYRYTAQQAAEIVHYINIVKGKHIKYWSIGNEPDLGYSFTTANQVAKYIKSFASAMKAVDPTILILGPETAWFNKGIIDGLTTPNGPDDITGKDASGRYDVDIISFHTYPFKGTQTRADVIAKLKSSGSLNDNLAYLKGRLNTCNQSHGRSGSSALKAAITEANVNFQNPGSDDVNGVGANSFIGGQFVAEMLGVSMKHGVEFVNIWSVIEGNSTALNIGFIDSQTGNKKPLYYHFKMLADNFKGTFANGTTNQANVKAFGSKNGQYTQVLIMNQDLNNNYNFSVRLDNNTVSGSKTLKVNIDAGVAIQYDESIPAQSTLLLTFNSSGTLVKKTEYTLANHAAHNLPPTETQLVATGINDPSSDATATSLEFKVFPNPTVGKFTITLDKKNTEEKTVDIQLINLVGQEVYKKKSQFLDGKEEIELDPSVASGVYVVRVKEGAHVKTEKLVLEKK